VLAALPPRERDVVAAIDIADLDVAATSRLLRITRTAVRSAHHRGLRRLAAVLADDSSGGRPPAAAAELRWPVTVARVAADGSVSS